MRDDPKWLAQFAKLKSKKGSFVVPSELPVLLLTAHKSKLLTAQELDRLKKLFALSKVTTDSSSLHSVIEPNKEFYLLFNSVQADKSCFRFLSMKFEHGCVHSQTDLVSPHMRTTAASACCIGQQSLAPVRPAIPQT